MGFYGNISNVNKTNMTFDKVYSNRKSMDESCALDGVYAGRYVLVQYEQYYPLDTLPIIYKLSSDKEEKFSTTYTQFSSLKIQENVIYRCVILTDWENDVIPVEKLLLQYYSNTFYRGVRNKDDDLFLENISSEISEKNYVGNFNIDRIEYNTSRGYDSTVWMKQYDNNGIPRYVNIAELNSVIPTFDVSVDAPTEIPNSPHFDEDSTNIYYNLHVQPQWGFRVKNAKNSNLSDVEDANKNKKAIYFNKAGFYKNNKNAYVDLKVVGEDSINITPTGVSGQLYNSHKKGEPKKAAPDIQELSINLPSIGNMMSEAWDYIYGPERDGYMGQWKKKEDLVDESIFINNAVDKEGYVLEDGERKDFSSFDGRLKSISLCEGETIPVKKSSDGSIIGASINKEEADDWIATAIDSEKLNITIKHKTKFEENQTNSRNTQTPSFGDSFNIPIITVDKAGHITSLEDNSVQLPLNGSSLELEGYSLDKDNTGLIKPKDSLITAFNKVENNKMDKIGPTGKGSFSLNRKKDSDIGAYSFAEGYDTTASGYTSHAEGYNTTASIEYSHAEGLKTTASGLASHAEGIETTASERGSHAEGNATFASGTFSHAEGDNTTASGDSSHAEGWAAVASGMASHVEGRETVASGMGSHSEGYDTIASGDYSHVQGKCNLKDVDGIYQHIVGNGSSDTNRSNAHTLDWEGNAWFQGDVYVGSDSGTNKDKGSKKLATEEYVNSKQSDWNQNDENASDYVKNRTHYDYEVIEELLPTTQVTIGDNGSDGYYKNSPFETIPLIVGDTYIVTYDDVEYNVVAYTTNSYTCLGNPGGITNDNLYGTGEIPFVYVIADDETTLFGTATTHTIAIQHQRIISTTVPDKYISEEIARTSKTLANINPSGTGSFSLNRQKDSEIGDCSHAEGNDTIASGAYSHAEGDGTTASGNSSHAEGRSTFALKDFSHAEGYNTFALEEFSHAEGYHSRSSGRGSHAEGYTTAASGANSHAEGYYTKASGANSHAEGEETIASGEDSHAEGWNTTASGRWSHAESFVTIASGDGSHAEGFGTIASGDGSHVQGKYNIEDADGIYQHIVGNGSSNISRSNVHTLDWDGNAWFAGDVYISSTNGTNKDEGSLKLATEQYVVNQVYNNTVKTPITITIPAGLMLGDVYKEGKITQEAGTLITKYVTKTETLSDEQKILADIDGDNVITISDAALIMEIAENPSLLQKRGKDMLEVWSISSDDSAKEHPFYKDIILPDITEESSAIIAIQDACEPNNFVAICQNGYIRIYAKWLPIVDLKAIVFYGNGDGSAIVLCGSTDIDSKLSLSGGTITGKLKVEVSPKSDLEVVNKKYLDERVPLWTEENNGQSLCIINDKPTWSKPTYTAEEIGALPSNTIIPTIPTSISAFNNDVGYLTEHQSLTEYAKIANIPSIVLNMSDFIALQDKIDELERRIAKLENPTTTE